MAVTEESLLWFSDHSAVSWGYVRKFCSLLGGCNGHVGGCSSPLGVFCGHCDVSRFPSGGSHGPQEGF